MLLRCDNSFCRGEFKLTADMIVTKPVIDDIKKTYFCCPYCGEEYVSLYTNSKIREVIEEIKNINSEIKSKKGKRNVLLKKKKTLQKKAADLVRELEIKMEKIRTGE